MKRILFLDDCPNRTKKFRRKWPMATTVETAQECIDKLDEKEWDIVWLDHDLGGETFVSSEDTNCGMEVVRWIMEAKPKIEHFIVHTLNPGAGDIMCDKLASIGYKVTRVPFIMLDHVEIH